MNGETDVYGLNVSDLQSGIVIGEFDISGTLLYVSEYPGFNGSDVSEQSGNYLALKVDVPEGANVTTELINGKKGAVDLTADKFCVYRITDKDTQQIKFTVSKNEESKVSVYSLAGLTLNEE